jgi:nicotinamidase-related amidase
MVCMAEISVNSTALSAIDGGFDTCVYTPCIRGIDTQGCQDALEGVKAKGGSCIDDLAALGEWVE